MPATRTAAQVSADTVPVDLLLRNVELMFREEAETKGLEFRVRGTDTAVTVDAMAAMRIVSNLVANAVRYTQRGKILVGCRRRGDRIAIVVADTGPGMDGNELARMFREGERCSSAADTEGSGLGLGIVQRLAAECGFPLRVASIPGRGSSFSVELPRGVDL